MMTKYTEIELDDLLDEWHHSPDDGVSVAEFLGWSTEEYKHWLETNEQPHYNPLARDSK